MNKYAISVINVSKKYNHTCALDNVSFNLAKGSCLGLVGPNGAGKTTLVDSITGIINIDSGGIFVLEEEMNLHSISIKNRMGILPQELSLLDYLKCNEYLSFVAQLYKVDKQQIDNRINSLLRVFGLYQKKDKLLCEFSVGMRKKVAFIATILHLPEIVILDEPFESVDPLSVVIMRKIIIRLLQKNTSILITSHNLDMIEKLCNEVAIIKDGKIIYNSDTKDIHSKIKNELTKETYNSLEEIFIDMTKQEQDGDVIPSWL